MRASDYNFSWPLDGGSAVLAYNALTGALVETTSPHADLIGDPQRVLHPGDMAHDAREFVGAMAPGGFFVEDGTDELSILKFRHYAQKYDQTFLALTIAPTMRCNFACSYCYEGHGQGSHPSGLATDTMGEEVQAALLAFVERRAPHLRTLSVTWYGGEPLVARDVVLSLSERFLRIADEHSVRYRADMVSNGYLLDESRELIDRLREAGVGSFQITLDGPQAVHDGRRPLKGGGPTFQRTVTNIRRLSDSGSCVRLRVNVDRDNVDQIPALLDALAAEGLSELTVGFNPVLPIGKACQSMSEACLTNEEVTRLALALSEQVERRGLGAAVGMAYPQALTLTCCAGKLHAYVVDPEGYLYKCWNEVGDPGQACGYLLETGKRRDRTRRLREIKWVTWEPFEDPACRACSYLPLCLGTRCRHACMTSDEKYDCTRWRHKLADVVMYRFRAQRQAQASPAGADG